MRSLLTLLVACALIGLTATNEARAQASTPRASAPAVEPTPIEGDQSAPAPTAGRVHTVDPAEEALEAKTRAVASQLRCVVCQGLSIEDSPTDLARDMRAIVKEQLASGRSPDEVKEYFVSKYGEWILLEPKPSGLNLAIYLLPVLGVVIGAGVVMRSARRWTRQAGREASLHNG